MGLSIPILLRDRIQSPDTLQQPSPGYKGPQVPAEEDCIHDTLLQITLTAPSSLYVHTTSGTFPMHSNEQDWDQSRLTPSISLDLMQSKIQVLPVASRH